MATRTQAEIIPNQVFLAIPWKTVRAKYESVRRQLKKTFPLSFIIVGREEEQSAVDLLATIKTRVTQSSYAIFDATGGNANVSLEYGFAEAKDVPRAIYLSDHKSSKSPLRETPIIADLAGKRQNRYKQEPSLLKLLEVFSKQHAYTKRFERFLTSSGSRQSKKRSRSLALKIIHALDGAGKVRRGDLVHGLLGDQSAYKEKEIDAMIRRLHNAELIVSGQGPFALVRVV